MFRNRLFQILSCAYKYPSRSVLAKIRYVTPVPLGFLMSVGCQKNPENHTHTWDEDKLEHDFLIRQATTVNVNAASQLLTITLVAIQDTSERLREALTKEICLITQALEWGEDGTPAQHWDQLVEIRGSLGDLKHNLRVLFSYMDYAEKLATVAAEISYLSGNIAASDAICERIDHACRTCKTQKQLTHDLQQESLEIQQRAIVTSPHLEEKLADSDEKIKPKSKMKKEKEN